MKRRAVLLLCSLAAAIPAAGAIEADAMLHAIAMVETRGHNAAVGRDGERSAWQLTEATWRRYTPLRFEVASRNPVLAYRIAREHLEAIIAQLARKNGRAPITARAIAERWNPRAPADYAERVENLYFDELARRRREQP